MRPCPLPMGSPYADTEPFHMHEVHMDLGCQPAPSNPREAYDPSHVSPPLPPPIAKTKRDPHFEAKEEDPVLVRGGAGRDATRGASPTLPGSCSIRPAIKPFGGLHRNILRRLLPGSGASPPNARRRRLFPVRRSDSLPFPPPLFYHAADSPAAARLPPRSWPPRLLGAWGSAASSDREAEAGPWNLTGSLAASGRRFSGALEEGRSGKCGACSMTCGMC
ncbi:unnamed protein product [Urochloa decumbens]|uniref:Uncharacterized protein n=1 Tax=Urochloa decumbens TaxID=240449 RepID=A0ABC8YW02_9POAL